MSFDPRYDDRPRRPRYEGSGTLRALLLVGLGCVLAAVGVWLFEHFRNRGDAPLTNPDARPREVTPAGPLDAEETENHGVYEKLNPSVVNVDIVQRQRIGWQNRVTERRTGAGSGFVWDDDGRMVTNYHVIADLYTTPNLIVRVTLADGTAWDAVVVGTAEQYDLAVLQFAPQSRPPKERLRKIDLGTSHDLKVGQKVFAIGNPLGLRLTMTKGIISALDRPIKSPAETTIPGGIQHQAPINPGNSGGPLLDRFGRLIGVNTAIATTGESGGSIGIGFAIPSDRVNEVVTEIIRHGKVLKPDLGIAKLVDQRELRRARYDHGVMIEQTVPGGPADAAGLRGLRANGRRVEQLGDVILAINGTAIESPDDFEAAVRKLKPGEQAKLKVLRTDLVVENGQRVPKESEKEVTVTVGGS